MNVPEITGYRVYYRQLTGEMTGQSDGTNFKDVERAETSTTEINGLSAGASYYVEVVGVASVGGEPLEGVRSTLDVSFVAEVSKPGIYNFFKSSMNPRVLQLTLNIYNVIHVMSCETVNINLGILSSQLSNVFFCFGKRVAQLHTLITSKTVNAM